MALDKSLEACNIADCTMIISWMSHFPEGPIAFDALACTQAQMQGGPLWKQKHKANYQGAINSF